MDKTALIFTVAGVEIFSGNVDISFDARVVTPVLNAIIVRKKHIKRRRGIGVAG